MRVSRPLQSLFVVAVLLCTAGYSALRVEAYSNGKTGRTQKSGSTPGCTCHCAKPSNSTKLKIASTASSFQPGRSYQFSVTLTNDNESMGGVNVAVQSGTISAGNGLQKLGKDLTHLCPQSLPSTWNFTYVAPSSPGYDTIFCVGNAVNDDRTNGSGDCSDQWNFGGKFVVKID